MTSAAIDPIDWTVFVKPFADANGLTNSESSFLMREFDGDIKLAQFQLESRYRPATAVWEGLAANLGFRLPFPVRIPLPHGNKVYHKLQSLTLARVGDVITLRCSTQYLGKPGSWNDGATCSFSQKFEYLPDVRTLTDIFEHWAPAQRELHRQRLAADPTRSHLQDEDFFRNPESWTLRDFLNQRGARLDKCGLGTCVTLSLGCLGYYGASDDIYLLSTGGHDGAITTRNGWPFVFFDDQKFLVGQASDFSNLPELQETPFEFA